MSAQVFGIGDRVVYPMHGAGVIEAIEEHEVLGVRQKYYIMRLPLGDMKVMIPMDTANDIGLRGVIDASGVEEVLGILRAQTPGMSSNWNRRYRANMDKIRTGNAVEVAEVVRNLTLRDREKGLSTGERKMLESARQILLSELVLAKNISAGEAQSILDGQFQ